jgi:hypothetical protein
MRSLLLSAIKGALGFTTQQPHREDIVIVSESESQAGISSMPSLSVNELDAPKESLMYPIGPTSETVPSPSKTIPGGVRGSTGGDVSLTSNKIGSVHQLWSVVKDLSCEEAMSFLLSRRYGIVLAVQHARANNFNHRPDWLEWLE